MSAFNTYGAEESSDEINAENSPNRLEASAASSFEIARRLGRKLTPVVVDLGPGQPRFASYLDWDEQQERSLLVPIAGEALSLAVAGSQHPVRIRSADTDEPWMLVPKALRVVSDRMAMVELGRSEAVRMSGRFPGRTQARGREPLVLAVHSGGASIEGHVFPVTSLGACHCLIDASAPLDPGQLLGPVEIIGERRIIRRASGRVIEVIPWVTAHGNRRFRCRLALDESVPTRTPEEAYDLFAEPDRIARLFELGSMLGLGGWYDAPGWARGKMRIGEIRDGIAVIEVDELPPPDAIPLPADVRLGFELFAVSYEGWVRLHRRRGNRLEVAFPYVLRRCRRRREQRAVVSPRAKVVLTFRNTATGEVVERPVRDLSFGGLSFIADASDLFWKGACLERARLAWDDERMDIGDLEVRALSRTPSGVALCHVANRGVGPSAESAFISLLASLYHPEAERHDGAEFRVMVDLYERAGLLGEFMVRNLQPQLPAATASWRKLHDRHSSVACTLLFRNQNHDPEAAFSGVRVWEKTWLLQHFGAVPGASRRATGTLQLAYVDFILPQRDTHYMAFFVRAENTRMNAFYEKFFELTGTQEAVNRVTVARWILRGDRGPQPAQSGHTGRPILSLRPMRRADEVVISRAAERTLGAMAATALSLVPGGFSLPETARRFARLGLRRSRKVCVIGDGDPYAAEPFTMKAALLKESTSPGVNLTWMLDAWWYLPIETYRTGDESAIASAATMIARAPSVVPGADKLLLVPQGVATAPLVESGLEKLADLHLYVMNRSGVRRYQEYVADRYGELDVMIKRSAARTARSAS